MEVVLRNGSLEATVAPNAAMLVTSLRHEGEELLGQRADAATFVEAGKTTGSPLLYPWANRLSATRFERAGKRSTLRRAPGRVRGADARAARGAARVDGGARRADRVVATRSGTRRRSRSRTRCGSSTS